MEATSKSLVTDRGLISQLELQVLVILEKHKCPFYRAASNLLYRVMLCSIMAAIGLSAPMANFGTGHQIRR